MYFAENFFITIFLRCKQHEMYCVWVYILSRTVSALSQLIVLTLDTLFLTPCGGLGTTYDVHLGFTGKRVVDFLLVLIKLLSLGVTAEALRAKIDRKSAISLQRGQFDPKFHSEADVPHKSFLHG